MLALSAAAIALLTSAATADAALTITAPADGAWTNDARVPVTFSGGAPGGEVRLDTLPTRSSPIAAGSGWADGDGAGTIEPDGDIATAPDQDVELRLSDGSGTPPRTTVHFDTIPDLWGPVDGSTRRRFDLDWDVTGAIPGGDVVLFVDGIPGSNHTADSAGHLAALQPDGPIEPGPHTFAAATRDARGHVSTRSAPVTVDVAPADPAFVQLFDGIQLNQHQPPVAVSGVDPEASEVTLFEVAGGGLVARGTVTDPAAIDSGLVTITPDLPDGNHSLVLAQTVNGVQSQVDLAPVIGTTVNTKAPALGGVGAFTKDARPWFTVAGLLDNRSVDNLTEVVLYVDGRELMRRNGFSGDATAMQPASALADGMHTAYAATVDDLAHVGAARSSTLTFTVDTVAPALFTRSPENGETVSYAAQKVVAQTEPGASVHLRIDDAQDEGSLIADGLGIAMFSPSRPLADGAHSLTLVATDAAGNASPVVVTPFTVNATKVAVPGTGPGSAAAKGGAATATLPAPSKVKLSATRLKRGKPAKLSFVLAHPGTLKLTVTRLVKERAVKIGAVKIPVAKAGAGSYALSTTFAKKRLTKGRYRLDLVAIGADGTLSATVTKTLTVA